MGSLKCCFDLGFESFDCLAVIPFVNVDDAPVLPDEVGGGHGLGANVRHKSLRVVEDHGKRWIETL